MKRCDWCGIMQDTVPVVLGEVRSKEMRDVNLCVSAIAELKMLLQYDGTVHIFMRGGPDPVTRSNEFDFNMLEH
jgi:hypothetical protein